MIPWLWAAAALGHGGPPRSDSLMWDSAGRMIVASSHGLIFEDERWSWVCDEVLGSAVPTEVILSGEHLLIRSTQGVAWSTDGCGWTWSAGVDGEVVWDIATDITDPGTVWAATAQGLLRSTDSGRTFTAADTPDPEASVRSFVQMPDTTWTVLGFIDGLPTAWLGSADDWQAVTLPSEGGHLIALGADDSGHAYARLPMASGTDTLVRLSPEGEVATVLETETSIDAFLSLDGALLVSIQGTGLQISTDHGQTWESRGSEPSRCLTVHDNQLYGCPDDTRRLMWTATLDLFSETPQWTPGPGFDAVSGPRCDNLLTCDMVWPQVQRELGLVVATDTGDTGEPSSAPSDVHCGCSHGAAVVLLPWGMLWARRRSGGSS